MAITKNGDDEIVYSTPPNQLRSQATGTVVDDEFAVVDNANVLKQVKFDITPLSDTPGILTIACEIDGDLTVDLMAVGAYLPLAGGTLSGDLTMAPGKRISSATGALTISADDGSVLELSSGGAEGILISNVYGVNIGGGVAGVTVQSDLAMSAKNITGLLDPANPQDAATKAYVDAAIAAAIALL